MVACTRRVSPTVTKCWRVVISADIVVRDHARRALSDVVTSAHIKRRVTTRVDRNVYRADCRALIAAGIANVQSYAGRFVIAYDVTVRAQPGWNVAIAASVCAAKDVRIFVVFASRIMKFSLVSVQQHGL
jgi:hypothetical protein